MTRRKTPDRAGHAKNRQLFDKLLDAARGKFVEHPTLSERDSRRVQAILENPPSANAKMRAVAEALP